MNLIFKDIWGFLKSAIANAMKILNFARKSHCYARHYFLLMADLNCLTSFSNR